MSLRFLLLLTLFGIGTASAQQVEPFYGLIYRPPDVHYLVLRSAHFDLIYQEGGEQQARELAAVLEDALPVVERLLPVRDRFRMPVVLNQFNDRGNGYVTPVAFRQEIEGVALKGSALSYRHESWLEAVGPHELVHAAQGDFNPGFGFSGVLRWFAPDAARAFNLWVPGGISEGAAVYLESQIRPGAGRLNHPYFRMQFRASMADGRPWSLSQMLEEPAFTRPTDRFYKGGAEFIAWMAEDDGSVPFFRRAAAFHNRMPFLGYGPSLWYGSGVPPWLLARRFRRDALVTERGRLADLGALTQARTVVRRTGVLNRRPQWVDEHRVVIYRTGYHDRRGFYEVDTRDGSSRVIAHEAITEDLYFQLDPLGGGVLFSRYVADRAVATKFTAEVFRLDLATGRTRQLSENGRMIAPAVTRDRSLWALRTAGSFTKWVDANTGREVVPSERTRWVALMPDPEGRRTLAIANVEGVQGLYLTSNPREGLRPLAVFRNGSVADASWVPGGDWVVFTADPTGVLNIYAAEVQTGRLVRLTNVAYGAYEGSVSPDGTQLAFVAYADERMDLVTMPFEPERGMSVPESSLLLDPPDPAAVREPPSVAQRSGEVSEYRALPRLAPRMFYPTFYYDPEYSGPSDADFQFGGGLAFQGSDPLQRHAYFGEGYARGGRLWGEFAIGTAASVFRPSIRAFSRSSPWSGNLLQPDGSREFVRLVQESTGIEAGVAVPLTFSNNVYGSSARFALNTRFEKDRILGQDLEPISDYVRRVSLSPVAVLQLGVSRNLRDLVPNSGLVAVATAETDLWRDGFEQQGVFAEAGLYVPWLMRFGTGIKFEAAAIHQNIRNVYNVDQFVPRGFLRRGIPGGEHARVGVEVTQPLWFIDDGMVTLPVFFQVLYAYGFGETLREIDGTRVRQTSVGGGVGFRFRIFYIATIDLRVGSAYRVQEKDWTTVYH